MKVSQDSSWSSNRGFTLLELMIAMVIVGIVSTYAYSSYQKSILKSGRTEAKNAVTQIAAAEEQARFGANNTYAYTVATVYPAAVSPYTPNTPHNLYTVSIKTQPNSGYLIIAVPATGSRQVKDGDCQYFSLDNKGQQLSYNNTSASGTPNTSTCW